MADNVQITAGAGTSIKTDSDPSGNQIQHVKLNLAADGASQPAASGNTTTQSSPAGFINDIPMGIYNNASNTPAPAQGNLVPFQMDANGNLKVNAGIISESINQTNPTVTTSTASILVAKAGRAYLFLQNNDPTNTIYIGFGVAASTTTGLKLVPGATFVMESSTVTNQAINAISSTSSTSLLTVLEG